MGAKVDGNVAAFLRNGCSRRGQVPFGVRTRGLTVGVLEQAGLVITEKVGRVRTCKLGPHRLEEATAWLEKYRQLWAERFDELDKVIEDLKQREKLDGRKKRE